MCVHLLVNWIVRKMHGESNIKKKITEMFLVAVLLTYRCSRPYHFHLELHNLQTDRSRSDKVEKCRTGNLPCTHSCKSSQFVGRNHLGLVHHTSPANRGYITCWIIRSTTHQIARHWPPIAIIRSTTHQIATHWPPIAIPPLQPLVVYVGLLTRHTYA
jgi:hypothetical protein